MQWNYCLAILVTLVALHVSVKLWIWMGKCITKVYTNVKGNVLETHPLEDFTRSLITRSSLAGSPEQGEDLIIPTRYAEGAGLTKTSFHIRLEGRDSQGEFRRLHPPLISPVTPRVEVTAQ